MVLHHFVGKGHLPDRIHVFWWNSVYISNISWSCSRCFLSVWWTSLSRSHHSLVIFYSVNANDNKCHFCVLICSNNKRKIHNSVCMTLQPCWKKTIEPCPKHNRKSNGFNGYNGNCIGFNGNYNGVYWYVMDSIGGMLNPVGKMPKTHYKKEFCNGFTGKS